MRNKSPSAVAKIGCDDIKAVSLYLGEKDFLLGDKPSRVRITCSSADSRVGLGLGVGWWCWTGKAHLRGELSDLHNRLYSSIQN